MFRLWHGTTGHHVVSVNVDAAPLLVSFVVDGVLCDGGGFNTYVHDGGMMALVTPVVLASRH